MQQSDPQLIQQVLQGNQEAFSPLVKKYQKGVHALAWRKIGDFHIAQEVTQDAFLKAYRQLRTLKDPNAFSGWLYVIVARECLDWLRKNRIPMESLDTTDPGEVDKVSYSQYVAEKQKSETDETRREVVKELLKKLPESERTVMTLHYLGEMTIKAVSEFLGVSENTVKSRLNRARNRLRKEEDVIRENLGSFQLTNQLTENIMREVSRIIPAVPATSKPMIPWAALGAATVLIILMLGVSSQYLARFQKPYSFEALSEPTVEIIDAPIVIDTISKPAVRRQFGRSEVSSKSTGAGTLISEANLRSNTQGVQREFSTAQWTQGNAPPGGPVRDIFATSKGTVYALSKTGIYRFTGGAADWTRINTQVPISKSLMPMTEHKDTLYIVSTEAIFSSGDDGETWNTLSPRPKGQAVGLVMIDTMSVSSSRADITMYLAIKNKGVFQSVNGGARWHLLKDGMSAEIISTIAAVGKTVFAGTERGLYRLDSNVWNQMPIATSQAVCSLAVSEDNLYVGTGSDLLVKLSSPMEAWRSAGRNRTHSIQIFHSPDIGATWTDITPDDKYGFTGPPAGITLLAAGDTLMALGFVQFRSIDGGKTWSKLGYDPHSTAVNRLPTVAVNEKTFYKTGVFGIQRTVNAGDSWDLFINGMSGITLNDLIVFNNKLYASTGYEVYQSSDEGVSWKKLRIEGRDASATNYSALSRFIIFGNNLHFLLPMRSSLQIYGLSTEGDAFIPFQGVPAIENKAISTEGIASSIDERVKTDRLVVSGDVFYVEYRRKLFKWKLGDPAWTNTGLVDVGTPHVDEGTDGFRLAASGETVYVGKRDGELFQSLDGGGNWRDVTPALPLHFSRFKDIVFRGAILYIATDSGVLVSQTGEHWHVITDKSDRRVVINQFALEDTEVYGIGDTGVYRLDIRGQWEQISSEVPNKSVALAIINDRLYSASEDNGIFHISIAEETYNRSSHK